MDNYALHQSSQFNMADIFKENIHNFVRLSCLITIIIKFVLTFPCGPNAVYMDPVQGFEYNDYGQDLLCVILGLLVLRAPCFLTYLFGVSPRHNCCYWLRAVVAYIVSLAQFYFIKPFWMTLFFTLIMLL